MIPIWFWLALAAGGPVCDRVAGVVVRTDIGHGAASGVRRTAAVSYLRSDLFGNPARGKTFGKFGTCGNCGVRRPVVYDPEVAQKLCELCEDLLLSREEPDYAELRVIHQRRTPHKTLPGAALVEDMARRISR